MSRRQSTRYPVSGNLALSIPQDNHGLRVLDGGKDREGRRVVSREPRRPFGLHALAAALVLGVVLLAGMIDATHENAVQSTLSSVPVQRVMVTTGDSLWSIAEAHPIDGVETQRLVEWIRAENNLPSSSVRSGTFLTIPK